MDVWQPFGNKSLFFAGSLCGSLLQVATHHQCLVKGVEWEVHQQLVLGYYTIYDVG